MDETAWLGENLWDIPGPTPDSSYRLRLTFGMVNGRPEVVGFEMWGTDPRTQPRDWNRYERAELRDGSFDVEGVTPILTSTLRGISPQSLVAEWIAKNQWISKLILESPTANPEWKARVREAADELSSASSGSRRGRKRIYGPAHFEQVAEVYRSARKLGQPPTKAVAERWHVGESTANKWVARARHEFNLLPETTRGKAASVKADTKGSKR